MEFAPGLPGLAATAATAVIAYAGMLTVLRAAGKRALAKWNAFDFVVTVALGSSLATVILSRPSRRGPGDRRQHQRDRAHAGAGKRACRRPRGRKVAG